MTISQEDLAFWEQIPWQQRGRLIHTLTAGQRKLIKKISLMQVPSVYEAMQLADDTSEILRELTMTMWEPA